MKTESSEQDNRETFFSLATQNLGRLYECVRHQLAYAESVGDLTPRELTPEDVVDAVMLRAYREFVKQPAGRQMGSWLTELANEQIQKEIRRRKSERRSTVPIEADIPETPPAEEVATLGEEIFEFYQPDEDLKLEDIFPEADVSTPEEWAAAREELLRCVNAALAGMPSEWRRALRLRHTQGLTSEELAEALDKDEPEIERILEYARQHLREQLMHSGCTFIVKDSGEGPSRPQPAPSSSPASRGGKKRRSRGF
jgi:RNA polymerase sigma factor (sigma-70 family)